MTDFNLNDDVGVRLTERGREIHLRDHQELMATIVANGGPSLQYRPPVEDAGGWSWWQLWHLMQVFGPHITMGMAPPFGLQIKLREPRGLPRDLPVLVVRKFDFA